MVGEKKRMERDLTDNPLEFLFFRVQILKRDQTVGEHNIPPPFSLFEKN
jgi:hypothetical protein